MKTTTITKVKQLERYAQQLAKLVKTGRFRALSAKKRKKLTNRIERLQSQLALFSKTREVKKAFAFATVALGLALGNPAQAQNFNFKTQQVNPFNIQAITGYFAFPTLGDLDNDGDLDMIIGEYTNTGVLNYYQNVGDAINPSFATPVTNPFGITPNTGYFMAPELVDIDNDGDLDMFTVQDYGIFFHQNVGDSISPSFAAPVLNTFGIGYQDNTSIDFEDLDGDGDLDVILGDYSYGHFQYYENTGTKSAPAFSNFAINPFGLTSINQYTLVSIGDVDGDGDFDILAGEYNGSLQYFQNTGTTQAPSFAAPVANPFGITAGTGASIADPVWADIDKDGDMDLFVGVYYGGQVIFQEYNIAPTSADTTVSTVKNTDYTFAINDFVFADSDDSTMTGIKVSTLPTLGTLNLSGMPVAVGDTILTADIPNLTFSPLMDEVGTPYDSLYFQVFDGYLFSDNYKVTVIVEAPVETNGQTFVNDRIIIAPNPVENTLNLFLEFTEPKLNAQIRILDVSGRVVHSELVDVEAFSFQRYIPVEQLQNGVYFVEFTHGKQQIVKRFLKQ